MQEISAVELMAIYKNVSIVDVREMDEYIDGHVPGAKHIPLSTIPVRNNEIDKSVKNYVICEAGGRSAQACAFLEQQGFDVVNIAGGTGSWRMMGAPLNTGGASMSAAKKPTHVVEDELALDDFVKRIRRAEGQMGGILRMVEEGRSCEDIVNQLAAVSKAIDKAAFSLISAGLKECLTDGKRNHEEVSAQLQKLFLTMA